MTLSERSATRRGFIWIAQYRILCCIQERVAVDQLSLNSHLKNCREHGMTNITELEALFASLDVPNADSNTSLPLGPIEPLSTLATPQEGYICPLCSIPFPRGSLQDPFRRIRDHYKKCHPESQNWQTSCRCQVQKWYGGDNKIRANLSQWVCVTPRPLLAVSKDPQIIAFKSIVEGLLPPRGENDHILDDRDIGAVVHRMHWQRFATRQCLKDHRLLLSRTAGIGHQQEDLPIGRLHEVCQQWMGYIEERLNELPSNLHFRLSALSRYVLY